MLPTHPQVTVTTKSKPKHDVALGYHSADDTPTSELEISGVWAMSESLNTPKLRKVGLILYTFYDSHVMICILSLLH